MDDLGFSEDLAISRLGSIHRVGIPPENLCFENDVDLFIHETNDIPAFLTSCRNRATLETVRKDLNTYIDWIQKEVHHVVNSDYSTFMSVCERVAGVDATVKILKAPLSHLQSQLHSTLNKLRTAKIESEQKCQDLSKIQSKKRQVQILLTTAKTLSHLENVFPQRSSSAHAETSSSSWIDVEIAAIEIAQLQVGLKQLEDTSMIRDVQKRVSHIISSFKRHISRLFMSNLDHLSEQKDLRPCQDSNHQPSSSTHDVMTDKLLSWCQEECEPDAFEVLCSCLRAAVTAECVGDLTEMLRTSIIKPNIEAIFSSHVSGIRGRSLSSEEVSRVFEAILSFLNDKLSPLFRASAVCNLTQLDVLCEAVWPEIETATCAQMPFIFAPGIADSFHKYYTVTQRFLTSLAMLHGHGPSSFLSHPSVLAFSKKWNLSIYFHLRFQDIATEFEKSLSNVVPTKLSQHASNESGFLLSETRALSESLFRCWSPDVHVPALNGRFLKLTLQLLARFSTWIRQGMHSLTPGATHSQESGGSIPNWSQLTADELVCVFSDAVKTSDWVKSILHHTICERGQLSPEQSSLVKDALAKSTQALHALSSDISAHTLSTVTHMCTESLTALRGITATYRMSNKQIPTKPSAFVSTVLGPLRTFFARGCASVALDTRHGWAIGVLTQVTQRYCEMSLELLSTVKKTEDSLNRLRVSSIGSLSNLAALDSMKGPVDPSALTDTDKICAQLYLDAEEFGKQMKTMGVDDSTFEPLIKFKDCLNTGRLVLEKAGTK